MNRNVESHFSMLPSADIQRSRFDRSQDIKFTFNVGDLIPFFVDEVLPGDTFDITTSKVVRMQTLLTPVMDNIYLDTYFFFVPNRLVWTHWRELMGENNSSAWIPVPEYSVPVIKLKDNSEVGDGAVQIGDIADYMGIPVGVSAAYNATENIPEFNALPLRCYDLIYSEWFRDENLVDPVNTQKSDTNYNYYSLYVAKKPYKAAKYHDYFTSCLPGMQKHAPVAAPVSDLGVGYRLGVYSTNLRHTLSWPGSAVSAGPLTGFYKDLSPSTNDFYGVFRPSASPNDVQTSSGSKNAVSLQSVGTTSTNPSADAFGFYPDNLYAWADPSVWKLGIDVSDLRYAFQLQKLYERDARGGTRYIELIRSHFNVMSPDARMQRPEYLGGNRIPISIHQITNQSQGENDFLGDLGAMSLTTDKHSDFVKSFTEHGFVIGRLTCRSKIEEKIWKAA